MRERESEDGNKNAKAVPITVRTLETLIRLSTAHAKARLSKQVLQEDCLAAFELLGYTIYSEHIDSSSSSKDSDNEMEIDDDDNMRKRKAKEDEDEKGKSKKKRKNKKEDTNELDELLKAKPDVDEDGEIFSEDTMKFVYKIRFACGIICFVNVCSDRGCASYNLVYKHTSAFSCIHLIADGNDM